MKKFYFIALCCILNIVTNAQDIEYCKIDMIDSVDNAYIIEVSISIPHEKGDEFWYTIISLKDTTKTSLNKEYKRIKKGHKYLFNLYEIDYIRDASYYRPFLWDITVENVAVRFKNTKRRHFSIFVTTDCLKGLYYNNCNN